MDAPDLSADQASFRVSVSEDPIDANALTTFVSHPRAGATAVFLGTVREHAEGREGITHLEYEAYGEVVESKIVEVVTEAMDRWELHRAIAVHRVGRLSLEEVSVGVAVSSSHREEAFAAARYIIDELKRRAPIWKKEHWPGGSEWVREDLRHR